MKEPKHLSYLFLKFLREQAAKTITDRERGSRGKKEIVSTLFMHWKRGAETETRALVCSPVLLDLGWRVTIHLRGWKGGRASSNGVSTRSKGLDWLAPGLSPDPIVSAHVVMGCVCSSDRMGGGDEVRGQRGNGERNRGGVVRRDERVERMRGWRRCEEAWRRSNGKEHRGGEAFKTLNYVCLLWSITMLPINIFSLSY